LERGLTTYKSTISKTCIKQEFTGIERAQIYSLGINDFMRRTKLSLKRIGIPID